MKYIILFLFATFAHADIYIQRGPSEQAVYMFHWVENGAVHCLGMPDVLDPAYIPQIWTPVPQAAIDYQWPLMTDDAAAACLAGPKIYKTIGGQLFGMDLGFNVSAIGTVPKDIACGEQIAQWFFLRTVTHAGQKGFAVCL